MKNIKSLFLLFVFILTFQGISGSPYNRLKRRVLRRSFKKDDKDSICSLIYSTGLAYNADKETPKFTSADFEGSKLILFTTIKLNSKNKVFTFNYETSNTPEHKTAESLKSFFESHKFPPLMNWFDLKGCCLQNGKFEEKDIFNEVCFSMIYGFINYRFMLMVKYVEKAFQDGMRGQDYINGEVPLTPAQVARKRAESTAKPRDRRNFLQYQSDVNKGVGKVVSTKAGRSKDRDKALYDFPSEPYEKAQSAYIASLKNRLAKSCSISYVIPSPCSVKIRICPFFFDYDFNLLNEKAKEEEDKDQKSKTAAIKDDKDTTKYFSFHCLKDGYFLSCSDEKKFEETFETQIKKNPSGPITVDQDIRRDSIKVFYFGSVTATSDLDFTIVTFQSSVIKNFHLQRIIIDNYNNRYQNDMTVILAGEGGKGKCMTTGDCLDTNAYLTGFIDSKFQKGEITGIEEIDQIFQNQESKTQLANFNEAAFEASSALGMIALIQFWNEMKGENLGDTLDLDYQVNFQEGILGEFDVLKSKPEFFAPLISSYLELLGVSPELILNLNMDYKEEAAKILFESVNAFSIAVSENIFTIRKIQKNMNKEIGIEYNTLKFEKSVKLNQAYTLLTLDAVEMITHIQLVEAQVIENYKDFILTKGTALMYANEAYYNMGGIKYQTKGATVILCTSALEATYMIIGYDILHFYDLYPSNADPESPSYSLFDHGDSLLKLAKYFMRVLDIITGKCKIMGKEEPIQVFYKDFKETGYITDNLPADEVGSKWNGISSGFSKFFVKGGLDNLDAPIKENADIFKELLFNNLSEDFKELETQIMNMRILTIFSTMAMKLKKVYGQSPLELYKKVVDLEANVLSKFKGYFVMRKKDSIGAIAKLANFILTSMTFSFYVTQKVNDYFFDKLQGMFLDRFHSFITGRGAEEGKGLSDLIGMTDPSVSKEQIKKTLSWKNIKGEVKKDDSQSSRLAFAIFKSSFKRIEAKLNSEFKIKKKRRNHLILKSGK